jgi:hypothetical protein
MTPTELLNIITTAIVFGAVGRYLGYHKGFSDGQAFTIRMTWEAVKRHMSAPSIDEFRQAVTAPPPGAEP